MRAFVWLLVGLLIVIQQDFWNWDNSTLLFDFVPYTLAYQCVVSLLTAIVWIFAVQACWPRELDDDPVEGSQP